MKVIFTAPNKTAYHDNTTWFYAPQEPKKGHWLKPGEKVVVLTPEEFKELESQRKIEV